MEMKNWPERLLFWFDGAKRELPWRETKPRNPYHVWVSEIMLQQTRTEAVKPYFHSWVERFPTIEALADADEADVLHAWQGLGYYSRARNLHKAAKILKENYRSLMPKSLAEVKALPGIGDYTAGAILSMAYGQREAAIDGNVLRVYARLYNVEEDILKSTGKKKIVSLVEETLPARAGDFNEALMDLGAEICIPKHPRCEACPISNFCEALKHGNTESLPYRTPKKPQQEFSAACAICIREGKVLLRLRPPKGMLASMWEFPMALSAGAEDARMEIEKVLQGKVLQDLWHYSHIFTHRIWHMTAYEMESFEVPEGEYRWFTPEEYKKIPLAGPHARLAAFVEKLI